MLPILEPVLSITESLDTDPHWYYQALTELFVWAEGDEKKLRSTMQYIPANHTCCALKCWLCRFKGDCEDPDSLSVELTLMNLYMTSADFRTEYQILRTEIEKADCFKGPTQYVEILRLAESLGDVSPGAVWSEFVKIHPDSDIAYDRHVWEGAGLDPALLAPASLQYERDKAAPDEVLGAMRWIKRYNACDPADATIIQPIFQHHFQLRNDGRQSWLLSTTLVEWIMRENAVELYLDQNDLRAFTAECERRLHQLRTQIREADDYCEMDAPFAEAYITGIQRGWFKALKPVLLAFRAITVRCINPDLDTYSWNNETSFAGSFYQIPRIVSFIIHNAAKHDDESLHDLRRELARELISKLKPIKGDPSQRSLSKPKHAVPGFDPAVNEPDPIWRAGYLHALADLGIKQPGKGQSITPVIKKVSDHDRSPLVRETAKQTYARLNNLKSGWQSGSHKRLLFHAWWWLRQAHLLSLELEINEKEANRIRNTEFR